MTVETATQLYAWHSRHHVAHITRLRESMRLVTGAVQLAETDAQIARCFAVMAQLRPHLKEDEFVGRVRAQQAQGYRLAYLEDAGAVVAVAGFRVMEMLMTGRTLYVDDLVTDPSRRSLGYGKRMLDWLQAHAKAEGCDDVQPGLRDAAAGGACVLFPGADAGDELPLCEEGGVGKGLTPIGTDGSDLPRLNQGMFEAILGGPAITRWKVGLRGSGGSSPC